MSNTVLTLHDEAFEKVVIGVNKISNHVKQTLGPAGRTILIEVDMGAPEATKDGVKVAKSVKLADPVENMGAQSVKEISIKCNTETGDGTTSALVYAQAIMEGTHLIMKEGKISNINTFKKGLLAAAEEAKEFLHEQSTLLNKDGDNFEEYRKIALVSSNGDEEIADLIMEALEQIKDTGLVKLILGKSYESKVERIQGLTFDNGMISGSFADDMEKFIWNHTDALVFITDFKINHLKEIGSVLDFAGNNSRPLLVICDGIDEEALRFALTNVHNGALKICIVNAPGFGSQMQHRLNDIAVMTGGKSILKNTIPSLKDINSDSPENFLGKAESIIVKQHEFSIIGGKGNKEKINEHEKTIRLQIENEEDDYLRDKHKDRLAKLTTGVSIIYVGADSEIAAKEKMDRVEDALRAVKSTEENGYVVGGGLVLNYFADKKLSEISITNDYEMGKTTLYAACKGVSLQILENAFITEQLVPDLEIGIDVLSGGGLINYKEKGIIDPTKVVLSSLSNAVSICSTLITLGGTIHMAPETYKPMML